MKRPTKKRTVQRRPRQWPLDRLVGQCRSAVIVWIALCDEAAEAGSNIITPTREGISKRTGIRRMPTISAALTALSEAKWIRIEHVPVVENRCQVGTVLKITLFSRANEKRSFGKEHERIAPNPANEKRSLGTGAANIGKNGSRANEKRSIAIERKTFQDSPTERGGTYSPPSSAAREGERHPKEPKREHPADRIERERMAVIRAEREAHEAAETATHAGATL